MAAVPEAGPGGSERGEKEAQALNMTDPVADMLTRIRNAVAARHEYVNIPASKMKVAIADVLRKEGYIRDIELTDEGVRKIMRLELNYTGKKEPVLSGLQRVSKPGLRVYVQKREVPRVFGGLGGEVVCYVW
jgi:small subunit ribosomal protein S8